MPKILDKEKEISKEVEQAEKEAEKQVEKAQNEVKKEEQKQQEQVKKEVQKAQEKMGMDPDLKAAIYQGSALIANHNDKKTQWENDQISKMNDQMEARERKERKEFMSAYRKDARNTKRSKNSFMSSNETFRTNINETDKRFITYQEKIFAKQTKQLIGLYTIIIDTSTKTAKEIKELFRARKYETAYIKNVEVDSSGVRYHSILRGGYHGLYRSKT